MNKQDEWGLLALALFFILEIALGGSGVWSENILGFSIRKLLFVLFFLYMLVVPLAKSDMRLYIFACCAVLFYLIWAIVVPLYYNNLGNSIKDFPSIFGITFLSFLAVRISENFFSKLVLFSAKCSLGLAYLHCLIAIMLNFELITAFELNHLLLNRFVREEEVFIFTVEPSLRVFWASSSFMLIGYLYYISKAMTGSGRPVLNYISIAVHCFAFVVTDTRAFQIFMVMTPFLYFLFSVFHKLKLEQRSRYITALWYVGALVVLEFMIVSLVNPEILIYLGLVKPGEGSERYDQVVAIFESFSESLWWGKGFGSFSEDLIRSEIAPWSYEMSIAALLMKLGIFGLSFLVALLFFSLVLPLIYSEVQDSKFESNKVQKQVRLLAAAGMAYLLVVSTNPYLFSLVGFATNLVFYSWYILNTKFKKVV